MSKKYGVMDDYFQIYNINRILNSEDLPDDYMSNFDKNLHLPENLWNLRNLWRKYVYFYKN